MKLFVSVLFLALLLLPQHAPATSYPVLYVAPNGLSFWPCGTEATQPCKSIATAVSHANTYLTTTIKVAQGNYAEYIPIMGNLPDSGAGQLTIQGGWDAGFSSRNNDPSLTTIIHETGRAQIFYLQPGTWARIGLRLESLTLQRADLSNINALYVDNFNGAVELSISSCLLRNCIGPALYLSTTAGTTILNVDRSRIENNVGNAGSGIMIFGFNNSTIDAIFTKNKFLNNSAGIYNGGGLYLMASTGVVITSTLTNNIFAGNNAAMGGALALQASLTGKVSLTLTNNTITENHSQSGGGGILISSQDEGDASLNIQNSIVKGNTRATEMGDLHILQNSLTSSSSVTAGYSLIGPSYVTQGSYTAVKTYDKDPILSADYHLSSNSPARDSGRCGTINLIIYWRVAPYDDIDGDMRPGYGTLSGCDIGADEYTFPWILFNPVFVLKN